MTGLRDRQKRDRERRILDAASRLFRERGYAETHIGAIALEAGLSVGALYNYYRSKGDLLAAIVGLEVTEVLKLGEAVVADPPADPAAALDALVAIYYEHSLVYLDKAMWRHAIAQTTQHPGMPFARAYMELDRLLSAQVGALFAAQQSRGRVSPTLDPAVAGALVFNNLDRMFLGYVRDESMTLDALRDAVAVHHRLIARAVAP